MAAANFRDAGVAAYVDARLTDIGQAPPRFG